MEDRQKIYYKSDFDFEVSLYDYSDVLGKGLEKCEFEGRVFSELYRKHEYRFSHSGKVWRHCAPGKERVDAMGNRSIGIRVICDRHGLPPGPLLLELSVHFPDTAYPDGFRTHAHRSRLPIELVEDGCDCGCPGIESVHVTLPYIYASAYRQAVEQGYAGSEEEYGRMLASLPETVERMDAALGKLEEGGCPGGDGSGPVKVIRFDEDTGALYI